MTTNVTFTDLLTPAVAQLLRDVQLEPGISVVVDPLTNGPDLTVLVLVDADGEVVGEADVVLPGTVEHGWHAVYLLDEQDATPALEEALGKVLRHVTGHGDWSPFTPDVGLLVGGWTAA